MKLKYFSTGPYLRHSIVNQSSEPKSITFRKHGESLDRRIAEKSGKFPYKAVDAISASHDNSMISDSSVIQPSGLEFGSINNSTRGKRSKK